MDWVRHRYRGNKVWIEVDDAGRPVQDARGLLQMRYRPDDEKTYSVRASEVHALEDPAAASTAPPGPEGALHVAVAAARGRAGMAGLGAVLRRGARRRELARPLRCSNGRTALWEAVVMALGAVRSSTLPTRLHVRSEAERRALRQAPEAAVLGPALAAAAQRALGRFPDLAVAEHDERAAGALAEAVRLARAAALPPTGADARPRPDGPPGAP